MNKREAKRMAARMIAIWIENGVAAGISSDENSLGDASEADLDRLHTALEEIQQEMILRGGGTLDFAEFHPPPTRKRKEREIKLPTTRRWR